MIEIDVVLAVAAAVAVFLLRDPIASIFTDDVDVVDVTAFVLLLVAVQQPVNGVVFALDGILIGAGDLAYLARTMVIATAIFAVLGASVMIAELGIGWLWAALGVFMVLRAWFLVRRYRTDVWLVTGA